jgi:hypothetical protein
MDFAFIFKPLQQNLKVVGQKSEEVAVEQGLPLDENGLRAPLAD